MNQEFLHRLQAHISAKRLLDHPFYQAWKSGALTMEDLKLYAAQYYHFEANFPRFLSAVHARCPEPAVRQTILSNLWDEEHGEDNHRALWLRFCSGLGLNQQQVLASPTHPDTRALVQTYAGACSQGSYLEGMAAIYAYEAQVPEVMEDKMAGLRDLYGMADEDSLAFFQVHHHIDQEHSRLEAEAIATHTDTASEPAVEAGLQAGLDAWWGFLDGVNRRRPSRRPAGRVKFWGVV